MNEEPEMILDNEINRKPAIRRRKLLPFWIKFFLWIFLVFGALVPVAIIFAIAGFKFDLALYGISTSDPFSLAGLLLIALFILKSAAAFGLWTEKDWGPTAGIADGIAGIMICLYMTVIPFFDQGSGFDANFRIELILLIPYLFKLVTIRDDWKEAGGN